jgi:MFS transporter, FSR family, fosmidomycin resistance protein
VVRLARRLASVGLILVAIDFFDELASGLPAAGAPELRSDLGAGVAALTIAIFTTPLVLSLVVDVPLLLWAERRPRAKMVALGVFGMGLSLVGAALATSVVGFAVAFALFAPASGLACGLAQASLMDAEPARREENMAAWTFSGTLGDLCAPLAIAGAVAATGGHRLAWWAIGAGLIGLAPLLALRPLPNAATLDEDEPAEPFWVALRNRELVLWLVGVSLCGLLDEIFAAYAALSLRDRFPSDPSVVTQALTAGTVGALVGLVALRRLLRSVTPSRLLAFACIGSVVAYVAWLRSSSATAGIVWMGVVCAFVSWQYPLTQARAYRAARGRSGLVAALSPAVTSFELAAPFVLGLVAERFGLAAALTALLAQPVGLVSVILACRRFPSRGFWSDCESVNTELQNSAKVADRRGVQGD